MRFSLVLSAVMGFGFLVASAAAQEPALPASVMAAGMHTAECDEPINADSIVETTDLGSGQSLVQVRCWRAAYQSGSIFFLVPAGAPDRARLLRFDEPGDKGTLKPSFSLSDPDFDATTRIMRTHYRSRGIGDCGTIGEWTWTGGEFKLTRYWSKPECDGELFEDEDKWRVFPPKR